MRTITSCVFSLISVGVQHSTKNPTMGSTPPIVDYNETVGVFHSPEATEARGNFLSEGVRLGLDKEITPDG